jgi:hypothetical protein
LELTSKLPARFNVYKAPISVYRDGCFAVQYWLINPGEHFAEDGASALGSVNLNFWYKLASKIVVQPLPEEVLLFD